jgi:hypothetical protein
MIYTEIQMDAKYTTEKREREREREEKKQKKKKQ